MNLIASSNFLSFSIEITVIIELSFGSTDNATLITPTRFKQNQLVTYMEYGLTACHLQVGNLIKQRVDAQ